METLKIMAETMVLEILVTLERVILEILVALELVLVEILAILETLAIITTTMEETHLWLALHSMRDLIALADSSMLASHLLLVTLFALVSMKSLF